MRLFILIAASIFLASCAAQSPPQHSSADLYNLMRQDQDSSGVVEAN